MNITETRNESDRLNIAIVAPYGYVLPPDGYGGSEFVASELASELDAMGMNITVYACAGSALGSTIEIVPVCDGPLLRIASSAEEYAALSSSAIKASLADICSRGGYFDIIDFHSSPESEAAIHAREIGVITPSLTTLHGRLDIVPDQVRLLRKYMNPLVSISNAQRLHAPDLNYIGDPVYNGVKIPLHEIQEPGDYMTFIGRIHPTGEVDDRGRFIDEKGLLDAIDFAREAEVKLVVAAKVDYRNPNHREYFENIALPAMRSYAECEFVGEVTHAERDKLLEESKAHLLDAKSPESFGLTAAEAGAAGVPVITRNIGALPEIVQDGVTGFVCDTDQQIIAAMNRIQEIDRNDCRERIKNNFTTRKSALDKLDRYRMLLDA